MKHYISKTEFKNIVLNIEADTIILLEDEEGNNTQMQFHPVDFNGGVILYSSPMSDHTGIIQNDFFGSSEDKVEDLFDTLEENLYHPYREE